MPWCNHCQRETFHETLEIAVWCESCGKTISDNIYSDAVNFDQDGRADCKAQRIDNGNNSRERTLDKARNKISDIMFDLNMHGGDSILTPATRFYQLALIRNFTRGRSTDMVAAACLYIACRSSEEPKAYMLIDFSDVLQVNVYELGAVFLELCKLLRLGDHPTILKLFDPSLFIRRFTDKLFENRDDDDDRSGVEKTTKKILRSMTKDWMLTGRKPSGLCGAALYISAHSYGIKITLSDVARIVHICKATLSKRLIEFEDTDSGCLTIDEFNVKVSEEEKQSHLPDIVDKSSGVMELLCVHKGTKVSHFQHGLCEVCYRDFKEVWGGLTGGSDPPAFQRAEQKRLIEASAKANPSENAEEAIIFDAEVEASPRSSQEPIYKAKLNFKQSGINDDANDQLHSEIDNLIGDESETLSDLDSDDSEINGYIFNEEESRIKEEIWKVMNKEYIEEQAEKKAIADAAEREFETTLTNFSLEDREAKLLEFRATAAAAARSKKERQQKRAADAKNAIPAKSAAEATCQMLAKRKRSSKINYDVLNELFDDPSDSVNKKRWFESDSNKQPIEEAEEVEPDYMGHGNEYDEDLYGGDPSQYDYGEYGGYDEYGNDEDVEY